MSFAKFAQTNVPLAYKPPSRQQPLKVSDPWGKKHRWINHESWVVIPSHQAEDDQTIWIGSMYYLPRPSNVFNGCGWHSSELELMEDQE